MVICLSRIKKKVTLHKKRGQKFQFSEEFQFSKTFHVPPFGKTTDHPLRKSSTFYRSEFSCERNKQPTVKFNIDLEVLFIYRLIPRKLGFRGWVGFFDTTPISRHLKASFSVHGDVRHNSAYIWVSFNRYTRYSGACEIWRWVVYVDSEK
jgi:hypothetical protein